MHVLVLPRPQATAAYAYCFHSSDQALWCLDRCYCCCGWCGGVCRYIIPKPFDERLLPEVAGAVVEAAIATGVARLQDIDIVQYKRQLADLALRTSM